MTTLLLIRHGQTPNNVIGALDTALPGAGLTDLGHAQADDLVPRLDDRRIDRIVASAHDRARLTAEPLAAARGLTLMQDAGFGEIFAGELEMARTYEAADTYLDTAYAWATGDLTPRVPGGPTGAETLGRFDDAVSNAIAGVPEDGTVAIVSHGAVIRLWMTSRAVGITPEDARRRPIPNTTVMTIEGSPGAWRFVGWNEPRILDLAADDPTAHADEDETTDRAPR